MDHTFYCCNLNILLLYPMRLVVLSPQLQYQRCLVAQTPPVRSKHRHAGTGRVQRANSMDSSAFLPSPSYYHGGNGGKGGSSNCSNTSAKKGMLAFFETFRNKQATTHWWFDLLWLVAIQNQSIVSDELQLLFLQSIKIKLTATNPNPECFP
jgi:hypothetical protein